MAHITMLEISCHSSFISAPAFSSIKTISLANFACSPVPRVVGASSTVSQPPSEGSSSVHTDDSKPTTSIQIRLADGSRSVSHSSSKNVLQHSHRLEKYLDLEGFLEKSLKIKSTYTAPNKGTTILLWILVDIEYQNHMFKLRAIPE